MQPLQSLKDSELRYRRLFEAAQDGILILDAETGMIEDVNPYLIRMLGYSRKEFVEKKLWEVGAFKDIEASKEAFEALQDNEYIRYENLPLKAKDGRLIEVEFVSNVYRAGSDKVIQCNVRDITEHKRIILALQENEKKYFNLLNQSSDGIFIIDLLGNVLTVNKAMCRELEFSEEEFLAMKIWNLFPKQYLDQYREKLTKILAGESFEHSGEYEVQGKYGRNRYVELLSTPHYNGRDIIGFQGIARDITARRAAENALHESEARNRRLVEHLPTVVYTNAVGDASSTLYVSPQIEALLGYTPEEWLADPKLWSKKLHPEDRPRVLARVAATDRSQEPYEIEYRMVARDGRLVWVHDQIILINDMGGSGQLWQGTMLDITERKQAQQKLQESEKRFRALVENNSDAITLLDAQGIALYDSPAAPGMLGYAPEDWIGRDVFGLIHPDDLPGTRDLFEKLVKTPGARDHSTFRLRHKGGSWLWIKMVATNLLAEPAVQAVVLNYHDITERRLAEVALQKEKDRAQQYLDIAGVIVLVLAADGKVILINKKGCEILGYPEQEIVGKDWIDHFLPQDEKDRSGPAFAKTMAGEMELVEYFESPVLTKIGGERLVAWHNSALTDEAGRLIGVVSSGEDITERKHVEATLRKSLEQTARAGSTLLALSLAAQTAQGTHTPDTIYRAVGKAIKKLGFDLVIYDVDREKREVSMAFMNHPPKLVRAAEKLVGLSAKTHRFPLVADGFYESILLSDNAQMFFDTEAALAEALPSLLRPFAPQLIKLVEIKRAICAPLKKSGKHQGIMIVSGTDLADADVPAMDILAAQISVALENATLFDSLQSSNTELTLAYDATIEGWSHALDLRDKETEGHSLRVTELTVNLARSFDFSDADLMQIRWGALLHDIGKMGVPDGILFKPGALTEEEWAAMRKHPQFAHDLLAPIAHLKDALDIPYCHHEKWDGSGYPRGLKGNQIPPTARIFAVVDVWDALRSDRPYRAAWTEEKVREHIRALSGTHFDPQVVERFLQVVG